MIKKLKITEDEEEGFMLLYPTFFEEFENFGVSSSLYYVLFVIRRMIIVFIIWAVNSPILQLSISATLSITVLFN